MFILKIRAKKQLFCGESKNRFKLCTFKSLSQSLYRWIQRHSPPLVYFWWGRVISQIFYPNERFWKSQKHFSKANSHWQLIKPDNSHGTYQVIKSFTDSYLNRTIVTAPVKCFSKLVHPVKRLSGALKQEAASCVEPNSEQVRSKVTKQMFSAFATKKDRTVFKIEKKITTLIHFCRND